MTDDYKSLDLKSLRSSIRSALSAGAPATGDGTAAAQVETCRRICREHGDLLRRMGRPDIPDELASPEFLAGIYARSSRAAEAEVRPVLEAALRPSKAPEELDWADALVEEELPSLAGSLTPVAAPGWLWGRVRADVQQARASRQRQRRSSSRRALLAAGLMLGVIGLYFLTRAKNPGADGTFAPLNLVVKTVTVGPAPDLVLGG